MCHIFSVISRLSLFFYFIHFSTNGLIPFHPPLNYSANYTILSSNFFSEEIQKELYEDNKKIVGGQPRVANTADEV